MKKRTLKTETHTIVADSEVDLQNQINLIKKDLKANQEIRIAKQIVGVVTVFTSY
jgi:hypothetical protein